MVLLHWLGLIAGAMLGVIVSVLAAGALVTLIVTLRVGARFPPQGPFIEVDGGRLATMQAGPTRSSKGTVVLLHGASANAADPMEGVGRRLAQDGFRVIAFDRPGYGWSDRLGGRDAGSPAVQGHAIAQAVERMGTGPVVLLGHSWSGALATAIALDHPEVVSGLVLVAPVAMPFPAMAPLPWYYRLALKPPVAWLLSRTVATPIGLYYLERAGRAAFRPQELPADYLERSRSALVLRPATMLANLEDLIGLPSALAAQAPRYGEIAVPTVIVSGDADAAVPATRHADPLAKLIPGARLVLLPGIGHMVPYMATDALVDAVEGLATRIGATRQEQPVAR
ncbi:alpha/beta fold hydrolase [Methylobacterium bullatum]|uniref:2-hydroxy-6-oxononadienedioate/2-hydroxy-6-oxononatrienedioate hydrolase n=1 Tax=Methylobacterium bullatum TaxID=570505 RepID=A0A679JS60_9HYPH|nr:2-hydroxy-6-oxononadienedioate/2-hydroxy-6-oxononatrienedioate hydrolase [Methylobacterium bullatum]